MCLASCCFAETKWYNAAELRIDSKGWEDTPTPYCRLSKAVKDNVPVSVWNLSKQSAGLLVHFNTDSAEISLQWTLTGTLAMPHMPATGVSGIDLYHRSEKGHWQFLHNARPTAKKNNAVIKVNNAKRNLREYKIYLPLYNGIESLEIGVSKDAAFSQPPVSKNKPIVYYGTSITQGACASRPGMAYTAMLDRILDRPIINLGFSGSGKMESIMSKTIAEIDAEVFVIDCLWNLSSTEDKLIEQRTTTLIKTIRNSHANTPILFVGQSHFKEPHPTTKTKVLQRVINKSIDEGIKNIHFIEGNDLLGDDKDATVDGCHPNDLGMKRHADVLAPAIRKLIDN